MMNFQFTTPQINQILDALAQQPYIQVHELIAEIRRQGQEQLQAQAPEGPSTTQQQDIAEEQ